jgi:hypothetical protein
VKKELTEKKVCVNIWKTTRLEVLKQKTVYVLVSAVFSYK